MTRTPVRFLALLSLTAALSACGAGGSFGPMGPGSGGAPVDARDGRVFEIEPGPNADTDVVAAMVDLRPGDSPVFGCGYFELDNGIEVNGTEDVLITGCGIDETVPSFKNSRSQEGGSITNVRGITIEDLTALDSPGDGFKLKGADHNTLRRVRAIWSSGRNQPGEDTITAANYPSKLNVACTQPARENPANPLSLPGNTTSPDYTASVAAGRYGIYPVESRTILAEFAESIGASDADIYVGQTNNAIIRNSRAACNVPGFEIENMQSGEYLDNIAAVPSFGTASSTRWTPIAPIPSMPRANRCPPMKTASPSSPTSTRICRTVTTPTSSIRPVSASRPCGGWPASPPTTSSRATASTL